MKRFLQRFSFKESRYERPNQKWVCGAACEGKPCLRGPDAHGHCDAASECMPLRKGDRWYCTRPPAAGGPCPEGPRPDGSCCRPGVRCAPVRSIRARRALTCQLTVTFTLGALLILLGGQRGWRFISPGSLTLQHALSEATCADCHGTATSETALHSSVLGVIIHTNLDSQRCLNCHQFGSHPLSPHSFLPAELALLKAKAETNT
ncbi:MAG: hypothetical protein ACREIC_11285, partial [Limisphaerales bacterium]